MAVFRVEKTKDFTVMSNHHLRNVSLSLKAKGLLSLMLSLPDNWDYLFLKRVKFSNWMILVLAVLTFCISAELTTTFNAQPYIGNMLYSLFVIIATITRRKEFTNNINFYNI